MVDVNNPANTIYQPTWLKKYGWWVICIVIVLTGVVVAVSIKVVKEHRHDKQDYVSPTPIPSDENLPITLEHL